MSKKEGEICKFEIFVCALIYVMMTTFTAGLKTGVENDIFRSSEDMGNWGTPPPRIPPREVEVPVSDRI